jgi:hypothetical protein
MDIEDIELPNPWIPIKAIRAAAELKSTIRPGHRKAASSPPSTPCSRVSKSIGKLSSACSSINLHSRYNTASIESLNHIQVEIEGLQKESKFSGLVKRLNEEIFILSAQLRQANQIISQLTQKLSELNHKHILQLQALQERHEQKLRRNKHELDFLLKEITNKEQASRAQIDKKSETNQDLIEELENNSLEYQRQVDWLKEFCLEIVTNVKRKFDEDLRKIKSKCKEKIRRIKEKCKMGTLVDDDSTLVELSDDAEEEISRKFNCNRKSGIVG